MFQTAVAVVVGIGLASLPWLAKRTWRLVR